MTQIAKVLALALVSISAFSNAALADAITVPEPGSTSLFAIGAIGLVLVARTLRSKRPNTRSV